MSADSDHLHISTAILPRYKPSLQVVVIEKNSYRDDVIMTLYVLGKVSHTRASFPWQVFLAELDAETRPCVRTPSFHSLDLLKS